MIGSVSFKKTDGAALSLFFPMQLLSAACVASTACWPLKATPAGAAGTSVNPTELEDVERRDDGDEAEDDAESQHGMLLCLIFD